MLDERGTDALESNKQRERLLLVLRRGATVFCRFDDVLIACFCVRARIIARPQSLAMALKVKGGVIKLVSLAGTGFFYTTRKNPKAATKKLLLNKYDPVRWPARVRWRIIRAAVAFACCFVMYVAFVYARRFCDVTRCFARRRSAEENRVVDRSRVNTHDAQLHLFKSSVSPRT